MEQLSVEVMAVRWSGDDFAVLVAITDDGEEVTLTGPLAHVHEGESLELGGAWRDHPKHGRQFAVERLRIAAPASEDALLAYLASVKHVGPVGAAWLFDRHGVSVLEAIDRDPGGRLSEVPGIGAQRLPAAVRSWEQRGAERAIRLFLDEHGVPAAAASRLVRAMGAGAIERLRTDPYSATEVEGIGFATADALAQALGFAADDPARIEAGVVHALREAQDDGHCYLPRGELQFRAARFLGAEVADEIGQLAAAGRLIVDDEDRVIDPRVDAIERRLARNAGELLVAEPHLDAPGERPEGLSDEQWRAVCQAFECRLSILTGGPGTGKCVRGDTLVVVNGDLLPIEQVWETFRSGAEIADGGVWSIPNRRLMVPSIGPDGRITLARVTRMFRQRVRETGREVELRDGSHLVMTKPHRILGPDGWTTDIEVGHRICVPRRVPWVSRACDPELAELLAWQIAEGCETTSNSTTAVQISQKDVRVLERLRELGRRVEERHDIAMNSMPIRRAGCSVLSINSVAYRRHLESLGYVWGLPSRDKRIPGFVMRAPKEVVRRFLRHLFAAEASVAPDRGYVEITSASEVLVRQVSLLLRRWGILMSIRTKDSRATNGSNTWRTYYVGSITGPSLRAFAVDVGFADPVKEAKLFAAAAKRGNTNVDVVPASDFLTEAKSLSGLSRQFFGLSSSYFTDGKQPSPEVATRTLGRIEQLADGTARTSYEAHVGALKTRAEHRYKARNLAAFAALDKIAMRWICDRLRERISREVAYIEVKRVSPVELCGWVYDFEVQDTHNYVAGGMLTHNTTSMRALVELVRASGRRVRLCAPTGKAARRLAEVSGHDATTIHRLLEWSGEEGGFTRDESDPIPGADLLVVDEASMLSLRLADSLFRAVGPRTHVLLVGDADQLPPVGAGRVLDDLIESDAVPAVRLTEIFRQAKRSLIVRAAHAINHGELPPTQPDEDGLRDFFALQRGSAQEIFAEVVSLATERMPAHYGFDPVRDIQVLAPMYRGTAGIDALNDALRGRINPDGRPIAGTTFRVGDKVVETVNNHELMLMNGQTGVIVTADPKRDEVVLATDDDRRLTVSTGETATWRLAYCLSIHKSQGGQWPGVIVALATEHRIMLTRELLYTGLTRAASAAVGVWNPGALQLALERRSGRRYTRLAELVAA